MKKILLLIFGISINTGIISGYFTAQTKYFYMNYKVPKTEITQASYKFYNKKDYYGNTNEEAEFTLVENVFNTQNAILAGLSSMGLLFTFLYFRKLNLNNR